MSGKNEHYGCLKFIFDIVLGLLTGGLWWLYLLFKFIRTR